eukprot:RCo038309
MPCAVRAVTVVVLLLTVSVVVVAGFDWDDISFNVDRSFVPDGSSFDFGVLVTNVPSRTLLRWGTLLFSPSKTTSPEFAVNLTSCTWSGSSSAPWNWKCQSYLPLGVVNGTRYSLSSVSFVMADSTALSFSRGLPKVEFTAFSAISAYCDLTHGQKPVDITGSCSACDTDSSGPFCDERCNCVQGVCSSGLIGSGWCLRCNLDYYGSRCNTLCAVDLHCLPDSPGCQSTGNCSCQYSQTMGFWGGQGDCTRCAAPYRGLDCLSLPSSIGDRIA